VSSRELPMVITAQASYGELLTAWCWSYCELLGASRASCSWIIFLPLTPCLADCPRACRECRHAAALKMLCEMPLPDLVGPWHLALCSWHQLKVQCMHEIVARRKGAPDVNMVLDMVKSRRVPFLPACTDADACADHTLYACQAGSSK